MPVYAQTPQGSASLSGDQLRDLLRQAIDKIDSLQKESAAAQDYISSLERAATKDEELIKALQERDKIRLDTISALDAQIVAINQALAVSEKARADAIKEEERQKKNAHKWKSLIKWGTAAGVAIGVIATMALTKK